MAESSQSTLRPSNKRPMDTLKVYSPISANRFRSSYNDLTKKKLYETHDIVSKGHRTRCNTDPSSIEKSRKSALNFLVKETVKITSQIGMQSKRQTPSFLDPLHSPSQGYFDDGTNVFFGKLRARRVLEDLKLGEVNSIEQNAASTAAARREILFTNLWREFKRNQRCETLAYGAIRLKNFDRADQIIRDYGFVLIFVNNENHLEGITTANGYYLIYELKECSSKFSNIDWIDQGSTNSVGFGIRSAPSSPMAPLQGQSDTHGQSVVNLTGGSHSPSHPNTGNSKLDLKSLKNLPAPVTASSNRSISPQQQKLSASSKNDAPKEEKEKKRKELSSSRQKKFHRHFQQVSKDERVINYYSCALVSDILLQGHLYITDNYFAFYSNVFGFVTKLLIPTASVVRISKEKTAKIIPNAVGVATADERHVFGSFMSREAAFRLMVSVCTPLEPIEAIPKVPDIEVSEECSVEDDSSCSISGNESPPQAIDSTSDASQSLRQRALPTANSTDCIDGESKADIQGTAAKLVNSNSSPANLPVKSPIINSSKSPPPRIIPPRSFKLKFPTDLHIVYLGVVLTLILALFSAFLLYRILDFEARNRNQSNLDFRWGSGQDVDDIYNEALRWQKEMQSKSTEEAQIILNSNLQQIARVRKNLETLSLLIHDQKIPTSRFDSGTGGDQNHGGGFHNSGPSASNDGGGILGSNYGGDP